MENVIQILTGDDNVSHFKDENSFIYKKGLLINQCILILSIILSMKFDDTIYEPIFRGIWLLTCILWGAVLGTKEVVARKNQYGYFYYVGVIVFISILIKSYTMF